MKKMKLNELPSSFFESRVINDLPVVERILKEVRKSGDAALKKYTCEFDKVEIDDFKITSEEIKEAYSKIDKELVKNIKRAAENIARFAEKQLENYGSFSLELTRGVFTGQIISPIERVGVYVPGGMFPLISSLIMGAVPANVAGVQEVIVCSPPSNEGTIHPAVLVAADIVDVKEIYRVGGAQAIGAMAYGTESIRKVDKIVGPGNDYVNAAKKMVYGEVGIDFIAGPTEILIIADDSANPAVLAADLIAQAEHDVNAQAILVTTSQSLPEKVTDQLEIQLVNFVNARTARESLSTQGYILLAETLEEAFEFANRKAPEHLELQIKNPFSYIPKLKNYGSLFVGEYAAETLGDYSSGLNHTLPTSRAARYTGGLSVRDFLKIQTTLEVTKAGFEKIAPIAQSLAEAEGLEGHANSIKIRAQNSD